ncbi:MAG TPA: hypothetical protein VMP03_10035 [Methylomirabilota bacterium]|nr:hypothetical protein [Methylomirabilota bacterium]
MDPTTNPFPAAETDRHEIWEMLVRRDIDAFLARDWSMVEGDFIAEGFLGVHAHGSDIPDSWRIGFPTLAVYRDEWLRQAAETAETAYAEPLRPALFRATNLRDIDIGGDIAVAHKKFDGVVARADGGRDVLNWQTLYFCRRHQGRWKLTGFVGYMPFPTGRGGR